MTDIQVRYWANKETGRHNLATEEQAKNELAETSRHNLVGENISRDTLTETSRHNVATETQAKKELVETKRSNKANESIKRTQNAIQAQNASTNAYNAQTQRAKAQADIAYTNAKTKAQEWLNNWKEQNPTTASMKEAGITVDSKVLKNILGTTALTSDLIYKSTGTSVNSNSTVKKINKSVANSNSFTKVGSHGDYTIYSVTSGSGNIGSQKTVIYNTKTGKFVTKIS
jgi:hypothetical protein